MLIVFLLLMLLNPDEVLVLKNNKKILCDSYENKGGRVTVIRGDQTFSLPASAINWEASAAATEKLKAEREREAAEAKAAAEAESDKPHNYLMRDNHSKPEGEIALTNRDYHDNVASRSPSSGPVSIQLRRLNNSLLLDVVFNGVGPFTMVLDTGASTTTVSEDLAAKAGLRETGESVMVAGVGGMARVDVGVADSIMASGARVADMKVTIHDIPPLLSLGAHGLLGQDFLNNFSMTLEGNTLTLVPSSSGAAVGGLSETEVAEKLSVLEQGDKIGNDLNSHYAKARVLSEEYQTTNPMENGREKGRECQQLRQDIQSTKALMERFIGVVEQAEGIARTNGDKDTLRKLEKFSNCVPKLRQFVNDLDDYVRQLRWSYTNVDSLDKVTAERQRIIDDFTELTSDFYSFGNCM